MKPPAGPPWSVTDDDRRRQTPESKSILAPYTMWASYKTEKGKILADFPMGIPRGNIVLSSPEMTTVEQWIWCVIVKAVRGHVTLTRRVARVDKVVDDKSFAKPVDRSHTHHVLGGRLCACAHTRTHTSAE